MAAPLPLEGDGLVENLFHYLWTTDDLGGGPGVSVPPTVIYRGSQPVAWYFTSRRSGRIKRKHRANLTTAHIEHSFTKRKAATDIVAYYLYLPKSDSTSPAIEYFDTEALRDFLFKRPEIPHSSSPGSLQTTGILQQFSLPKGARNSTLRAIWSPKLCLLERRVNVHAIHNARFSVYERGVTFEEGGGAEALSRPEPVRGSMLPGMVQQVCERVVDHVTRVSYHKFRIARMVLRLQVDSDDRLWLLWSSSLRLQPPLTSSTIMIAPDMPTGETSIRPLDIVSDAKVPTFAFAQGSGGGRVSLSSTSYPEVDEEPRPGQIRCASCAQVVAHRALLPTTYKAVLAHFHHVLKFLRERVNEENQVSTEWPPDEHVVQQAGGVGFGILRYLKSVSSSSDDSSLPKTSSAMKVWQGRELLVPPVIRYMHPTLRAEDFARHRQDPIFLHKTVGVCERCCLVYADYATASLEANGLGIRTSASAPALLRPVREKPKHAEYFDDDPPGSLLLTTVNSDSPLTRGTRTAMRKTKPPASAWKPVPTDERRSEKFKAGPRSTLNSLPMAPKLPPRINSFESDDNDALRIPDGIHDGSPQLQQQQREEAFFRELYQQKDRDKRGGHALRHILEAADRLSKAKPQHRLAALGDSTQIGQSQSTGALMGAITEFKLSKKPGKNPYSIVQRIHGGDGGRVNVSKNQTTGSSAKSPEKHQAKQAMKTLKKTRNQGEGSPKKARFMSSREKRAAAEHRDYLVAALSDAQVQLEHIESLATLVISAPEIEANPIELAQKEKQHRRKMKNDKEEQPPSPQEENIAEKKLEVDQDLEDQEQHESQADDQNDDKQNHLDEEDKAIEDEEQGGSETLENPNNHGFEDETLDADQPLLQNAETEPNPPKNEEDDQSDIQNPTLAEDESNEVDQTYEIGHATENDTQGGLEKPDHNDFEDETLNADQPLLQEAETEQESHEEEENEIQNQELDEAQSNVVAKQQTEEEQFQREEALLEHEQNETKQDQELDYLTSDGQQQVQEQKQLPWEQNENQMQQQEVGSELEPNPPREQVQSQGDEDDYEDEYEDLGYEQEHGDQGDQDPQQQAEQVNREGDIAAQDEVEPTQNLLDQAQELLAAAPSSQSVDASDEHQVMLDHNVSNDTGDSNDQSVLTPLPPAFGILRDDSSDDSVIAADSAIAAALALPSSDEWTSAASDE